MSPFLIFFFSQDDGVAVVPVFAPYCTAPVFDAGGCIDTVSATIDCSATANVQNSHTAK